MTRAVSTLPYETVPTLLFVNKTLLAKDNIEIPREDWTWEDMYEGEQVISSELLYNVIKDGIIEPRFQEYEQVMSLADSEVSKILLENKNVDSAMKIFQRTINKYLQQQK